MFVVVLRSNDIKGFIRCVSIFSFDDDVNVNRLLCWINK